MQTNRLNDALSYAAQLHRSRTRKVSGIPYIAHLLSVSALILEYGGEADKAIGGLLHDAIEDQGGPLIEAEITTGFGTHVARIVRECSDSGGLDTAEGQVRKDA